jgi:hypothetical protein
VFFFEGLFEEGVIEVASCSELVQVVDLSLVEEITFEISLPPRKL